ncbi:MAG: beta-ketoacyl synthase chain length factor [Neisseriaceae bacterium]|nr:beta-ketoacyl synthase chain length factor [Neisseriaceae bacterium]
MLELHVQKTLFYHGKSDINSNKIQIIPAGQRRKLSTLAKMATSIALEALENDEVDFIVWVSRYGEENKTVDIMSNIVENYPPSPLQFSSSVHNSIGGLYSILLKDTTPYTSLGLSESILLNALFEAQSYIQSGYAKKVLLVIYDEPLPELYKMDSLLTPFSFACLLNDEQPNLFFGPVKNENINRNLFQEIQKFYDFFQNEIPSFTLEDCKINKCISNQ